MFVADQFTSSMTCLFVSEMVSISCRLVWHIVNKVACIDAFVNSITYVNYLISSQWNGRIDFTLM